MCNDEFVVGFHWQQQMRFLQAAPRQNYFHYVVLLAMCKWMLGWQSMQYQTHDLEDLNCEISMEVHVCISTIQYLVFQCLFVVLLVAAHVIIL